MSSKSWQYIWQCNKRDRHCNNNILLYRDGGNSARYQFFFYLVFRCLISESIWFFWATAHYILMMLFFGLYTRVIFFAKIAGRKNPWLFFFLFSWKGFKIPQFFSNLKYRLKTEIHENRPTLLSMQEYIAIASMYCPCKYVFDKHFLKSLSKV